MTAPRPVSATAASRPVNTSFMNLPAAVVSGPDATLAPRHPPTMTAPRPAAATAVSRPAAATAVNTSFMDLMDLFPKSK